MKNTLVILLIYNTFSFSQIESKIWYFGHNLGINFNSMPPFPLFNSNIFQDESTCTITDEFGNLLFYADKSNVYNWKHKIMKNGSNLLGNNGSSSQSPLVVQKPGEPTKFYLFYAADENIPSELRKLRYSIVDLCGDNGLGEVISGVKNVLIPGSYSERLNAISINKGDSYWILATGFGNSEFYSFKLDRAGFNINPIISDCKIRYPPQIGMIQPNNTGNKILYTGSLDATKDNGIWIMDFDINTGKVSNTQPINPSIHAYDALFSPDEKYIYYTAFWFPSGVYQYNIQTKATTTLIQNQSSYYVGAMHLGPDGIIYICDTRKPSLSCILKPNNDGNSCDFRENYFKCDPRGSNVLGLQNSVFNYGIIKNIRQDNFLGPDIFACNNINLELNSPNDCTFWSDGSVSKKMSITKIGTYYAYYKLCDEIVVDTINIIEGSTMKVKLPNDTSFCGLFQLNVLALDGFKNYEWSNGIIGKSNLISKYGEFWVCAIDSCNYRSCDTITILEKPGFTISTISDTVIKSGDFIKLNSLLSNANNSSKIKFQWTPKFGLSCTDCKDPIAMPKSTQKYRVRVFDLETGCFTEDCVIIKVECCLIK
ncbi:MAG: hypothetical protein HOP11_12310 [Saprospiraceae bacterium]|nr:hypothetical protein [Saprospiraceae bacterium]